MQPCHDMELMISLGYFRIWHEIGIPLVARQVYDSPYPSQSFPWPYLRIPFLSTIEAADQEGWSRRPKEHVFSLMAYLHIIIKNDPTKVIIMYSIYISRHSPQKLRPEYITWEGRSTAHVQKIKKIKKSDYMIFKCLLWIEQNRAKYTVIYLPCH